MSAGKFHSTRWTLVRQAGLPSEAGRAALSELCAIYYEPVFRFIRTRSADEDRARDLAHAFFEELLIREHVGSPDPAKGRFRSYLLGAVKHFLGRRHAHGHAGKRGGTAEHVDWDDSLEMSGDEQAHLAFDRDWALALIRHALQLMEQEMAAAGRSDHFRILQPWLDGGSPGNVREAALSLGLSENATNVTIHRLRQRFRVFVRNLVMDTTAFPADVNDEFRHLVDVLSAV